MGDMKRARLAGRLFFCQSELFLKITCCILRVSHMKVTG